MARRNSFNFQKWIDSNKHRLTPPISNMHLFDESTDMVVMVIGGANERTDYHDNPVEEFYYQLQGDIVLKIADDGDLYDVNIREGDVFFLPPHLRHSPQRPDQHSIGLVVEGNRRKGQEDGFEWYCFNCNSLLHRIQAELNDIVADLPPLFESFYEDVAARTCDNCGDVHPGRIAPAGWTTS